MSGLLLTPPQLVVQKEEGASLRFIPCVCQRAQNRDVHRTVPQMNSGTLEVLQLRGCHGQEQDDLALSGALLERNSAYSQQYSIEHELWKYPVALGRPLLGIYIGVSDRRPRKRVSKPLTLLHPAKVLPTTQATILDHLAY